LWTSVGQVPPRWLGYPSGILSADHPLNMIQIKMAPIALQQSPALRTYVAPAGERCLGGSNQRRPARRPAPPRRALHAAVTRLARPVAALVTGLVTALVFAAAPAQAQAQAVAQRLATVQITAGMHLIRAEVAQTDRERQIGLMHRETMPVNDGMLFVFEQASAQCFWMRNTLIPLSIAFLADDGTIVNIEDMKPQTEESHCSAKPVRYALEMNQGWFAKRGVKPGMRLGGAPFGKR
jgi:uncharacterized membrane protein (UPF0127 family)